MCSSEEALTDGNERVLDVLLLLEEIVQLRGR